MYSTGRTGGNRTLLNFMNELVKLGHEVSITTMYYDPWFPLSSDVKVISKKTRIDLYYLYGMQRINPRNMVHEHMSFLNKFMRLVPKVDINVATYSPTAYVASLKSMDGSTPFYHMQHFETIVFDDPLMKKFVFDTYFLPIYKIANSIWLRDKLFDITGENYQVVNPAIEHDIFYPRNPQCNADEKTGLQGKENNRIDIVALGKGGWKNAVGIYDAVSRVRLAVRDKKIVLHYFGLKPLKSIPFDGKDTVFHKNPSDEELARLYSNSDIQITFSEAESFPLPPLEAMACGCAVITTPYGTEDYAVDGENVIIVKPNDVNMLTDKLKMLIQDEHTRKRLGENGIKTSDRFNYPSQTKILEKEMKEAIDENAVKNWRFKIL
jgi:glycosyltransferase involved in cell wall biosynthesis